MRKENDRLKSQMMCRKCQKVKIQTLFLPCRHLVACEECAELVTNCFVCNVKILGTVRTYMLN